MVRSELIAKIAEENPSLTEADAEKVVRCMFEAIVEHLAAGGRVELRGFGTFTIRHRNPREGRDPRDGRTVHVEARVVPFFKTGKPLHNRLNN